MKRFVIQAALVAIGVLFSTQLIQAASGNPSLFNLVQPTTAISSAQSVSSPIAAAGSATNPSSTTALPKASAEPVANSGTLPGNILNGGILANLASLLQSMNAYLASAGATQYPYPPQNVAADGNPQAIGAGAAINQLSNTAISNPTITGGSVSGASIIGTISNAIDTALATIDDLTSNTITATNVTFTNATTTNASISNLAATNATTTNLAVAGSATLAAVILTNDNCSTYGNGGKLTTDAFGDVICAPDQGGSGSSVAGGNAQVQFNSGGSFAASAGFTYATSTNTLAVPNASIGAATTTSLFTTTASSTNLFAQTAALGSLALGSALPVSSGGTGISSPSAAGILLGTYGGGGWQQIATSSLGLLTTNVAEGSNLYFTTARAQNAISVSGAPLTYASGVVGINQANASQAGYLSSIDWTNFNGKLASTSLSAGAGIGYNSSTGAISNTGVTNLAAAYPLLTTGGTGSLTLSLGFGTTTANAWSSLQTFGSGYIDTASSTHTAQTNFTTASSTAFSATTAFFTTASTTNLSVGTGAGFLQASGNGSVSATSTFSASGIFGILGVGNGGTGISSPSAAGILLGTYGGGGWQQIATSSLGLLTTNVAEGLNLYFTTARVASVIAGTTTDALAQGTTNKYFSNALAQGAISVSGAPLTYASGVVGINQANASQAGYLSSIDWTNFNGKLASTSLSAGAGIGYNSSTGAISNTGVTNLAAAYPLLTTGGTGSLTLSLGFGTTTANAWSSLQTFGSGYIDTASSTHTAQTNFTTASSTAFSATTAFFTTASTTNLSVGTGAGFLQASGNGSVSATSTFSASGIFGILGVGNGGTGISSPSAAGILLGTYGGGGWQQIATSSLGLLTTNVAEGLNLYFTTARVASVIAGTTTDALAQGTTNKYFSNALAQGAISVSGAPLTYASGVVGINQANASQAGYLSSIDWTNFNGKLASTSLSAGAGIGYNSSTGAISNTGVTNLAAAYPLLTTDGTGSLTLSLGFGTTTANAWSSLQTFTSGYIDTASSTNVGAFTVSGNFTSTGNVLFGGNVGIGTASPGSPLMVQSSTQYSGIVLQNASHYVANLQGNGTGGDNGNLYLYNAGSQGVNLSASGSSFLDGGNVGIGSTNPTSPLQIGASGYTIATSTLSLVNATGNAGLVFTSYANGIGGQQDVGGIFAEADQGWVSKLHIILNNNWGQPTVEPMTIISNDGTVNVGIGTTSPSATFAVQGTGLFSGAITLPSVAANSLLYTNPTNQVTAAIIGSGISFSGGTLSASSPTIAISDWLTPAELDGGADASAALNAMGTALCARSIQGATVDLGPSYIKAHDVTFTCPISLVGAGGNGSTSGTVWNYTGASDHGLQYSPVGWPAVTQQNLIFQPSVQGVTFYNNDASDTRALDFRGVNGGSVNNIAFSGTIYNAIRLYGVYKFSISNVTANYYANIGPGVSNYVLEITGDMSGESSSGSSCTLGNCSTRTDLVSIRNFDSLGTNTGSGIYIHGTVDTTMGEHISIENKNYGLDVECASGFANLSYCPQFMTFTDLQSEGAVYEPIHLSDFTDFQCTDCYAAGNGSASNHAVDVGFTNYTPASGAGGGFRWTDGRMANVGGSCAWINAPDTKIDHSVIFDCNLANVGASGIQYVGYSPHEAAYNTFCDYLGASPPAMTGIYFSGSVATANISNNTFYGCSAGVTGSANSNFVHIDNLGPSASSVSNTFQDTGNVGIGTTSSYSGNELSIDASTNGIGVQIPQNDSGLMTFNGSNTGSYNAAVFLNGPSGSGSQVGSIVSSQTATAYNTTSDRRLKENIATTTEGLSTLLQIPVDNFDFINDPTHTQVQGFIAQNLKTVYPEAVTTNGDNGIVPLGPTSPPWSVDYGRITPLIVAAVQDIANITSTFEQNLIAWLGSAGNGINEFFAQIGNFDQVNTQHLCVGSTCVTPAQFQAMVAAANQSSTAASPSTTGTPDSTSSPQAPVIAINGANPAVIQVGAIYNDLGATITGPQADLNLGIKTFVNGLFASNIVLDTAQPATDTIDYVVTDSQGLTSTSTRTVIVAPATIAATSSPAQ